MKPEIIYEDDDVFAVHQPGSSRFTLVTFGSLTQRPDGMSFWGQKPVSRLGLDAIGILAKRENWYPRSAMARAAPTIVARLQPVRIGYGHSMGGYGALKHGALLGLTHALAVSPQGSIDPAEVPTDLRYHSYFRPEQHASMRVEAEDLAPLAVQVVDPYQRQDRAQAELIAATGRVHTIPLPYMFHATAQHLAGTAVLRDVLDLLLAGDIPGLRSVLRRHRATSAHWARCVGRAALAHDHPAMAEALWNRAISLGLSPADIRTDRALGLELLARRLFARKRPGDAERAETVALDAAGLCPLDQDSQLRIGLLLSREGRHAAAAPLLRRAVALKPDLAQAHLALASALHHLGLKEQALEAIRSAAEILPDDVTIARRMGHMLNAMRDFSASEAVFRRVLEAAATDAERGQASIDLCHVLTAQRRFPEALDLAEMAIALLPGDARAIEQVKQLRARLRGRGAGMFRLDTGQKPPLAGNAQRDKGPASGAQAAAPPLVEAPSAWASDPSQGKTSRIGPNATAMVRYGLHGCRRLAAMLISVFGSGSMRRRP